MTFTAFENWRQLQDHVRAGYSLWYQGPMDYRPVIVTAVVRRDGKLRVSPVYTDADPFTADDAHLTRFRRNESKTPGRVVETRSGATRIACGSVHPTVTTCILTPEHYEPHTDKNGRQFIDMGVVTVDDGRDDPDWGI